MYSINDIGKSKVEKAIEIASSYGNDDYTAMGKFTEDSPICNIVFACFDNMASRKLLFNKWLDHQLSKTPEYRKENPNEVNIYLDGRMSAENIQVFFVKSLEEAELYKKTLFEDEEVEALPCSYKATCQTGTIIGSIMSIGFLNHVANKKTGIPIREIPFAVEFNNAMMDFKTYNYNEYTI